MDSTLGDHNKCRICLTPDKEAIFIQLNGSNAEMFEEVFGVQLTTDGVELESVMCQNCFGKLENSHDFRAKGRRADREYFEIQRNLAITQQRSNETAQAADEVEPPEAAAIEAYSLSRVKHEPPAEFVLILPRATSDQSKDVDGIERKWVESVRLTKFDAKWKIKSKPFQTFLSCQHCQLVVRSQGNFNRHLGACSKIKSARLECDIGKGVQNKIQMSQHMLKHSTERKFRCAECGNGYKSKRGLTKHKKTHAKPIACFDCQKKFSTHQNYLNHYLKRHQVKVHGEKAVKCPICNKICRNRASLFLHSQTHSKIKCSICHRKISKNKFASHRRSHSSHFECDLCSFSTNDKSGLKTHIGRMHLLKKLVKDSK